MFTGLVETTGSLLQRKEMGNSLSLLLESSITDLRAGESISADGVCLTVVNPIGGRFFCDLSVETLNCSRFRELPCGAMINLERALRLSDRMGGHWVTGHVDQVCHVMHLEEVAQFRRVKFGGVTEVNSHYLFKKGSIAVNGVSLTLNEVDHSSFEVMLIPETLEKTNLKSSCVGDGVNIEIDFMAKMIVEKLKHWKEIPNGIIF